MPASVWALPAPDEFDTAPNNDDVPQAATPITIGMIERCDTGLNGCDRYYPQTHNFHRVADEDWLKFYAVKDAFYQINLFGEINETSLGIDGFQIGAAGETLPLAINLGQLFGEANEPDLRFSLNTDADGFIFIRIFPKEPPADDNGYVISVDRSRDFAGFIKGSLRDADTGEPIVGGWVVSKFEEPGDVGALETRSAVSLSPDGNYLIVHPSGENIAITAGAPGYEDSEPQESATLQDLEAIEVNFDLNRLPAGRGNFPPDRPIPTAPVDQDLVSIMPVHLSVAAFSDPDLSDTHVQSHWQIAESADFDALVLEAQTTFNLTDLVLAGPILSAESTYFWRVRFTDSSGFTSPWSMATAFMTAGDLLGDTNANGVPDDAEPDESTDLDGNSVPDENQPELLRVNSASGTAIVGMAVTSGNGQLVRAAVMDTASLGGASAPPAPLPLGLWTMRIETPSPGETIAVSIFTTEKIPSDATIYKHDAINGWYVYDGTAHIASDGSGVAVTLTDGGAGDGDGLANGIIVDPIGVSYNRVDPPAESSGGGGGGGCFLKTLIPRV
jgi:hypothetical protein